MGRYLVAVGMLCMFARAEAYGSDRVALTDRLHRASASSSLDDASLKPWHLKLSFQLFDSKGQATEQGTIEEWWRSPELYKTVYTSPSYTATEIHTKDGLYGTKGAPSAPYLLDLVLREAVHPMPEERDIANSKPDMQNETLGQVPLDCVMLSEEIPGISHAPLGLFPTYCFDHDADTLRLTSNFGSQLTVLNHVGNFQQRHVAIDQTTTLNTVNAVIGHIEALQGTTLDEDAFVPPGDFDKVSLDPTKVSSGVIAGLVLSQPRPVYPPRAKELHITGAVVLYERIGRDGLVHSLKLLNAPDPDLAISAIAAVRQWRYKPYLLNGQPTEVESTVTLHFNMGIENQ